MLQFDGSRYVDAKQYHLASFSTRNSTLNTSLRKPIRMKDFIQLCDSNTNGKIFSLTVNSVQMERKTAPKRATLFCSVYQKIYRPLSDDSRSFRKISEDSRRQPKISEDFRRCTETTKDVRKPLNFSKKNSENCRLYFRCNIHVPFFFREILLRKIPLLSNAKDHISRLREER